MQPGFVIELVKRLFDLESQGAGGLGASVVAIERSSGLRAISTQGSLCSAFWQSRDQYMAVFHQGHFWHWPCGDETFSAMIIDGLKMGFMKL